jgi:CBS domain-containing protein
MSSPVFTRRASDSIAELMALMTERRIRHVPVIEDGTLAGIVSIGDVVKNRLEEVESEASSMREFIAGA